MGSEVQRSVTAGVFWPVPSVPDRQVIEQAVLERWERTRVFERLRERCRGGTAFSFLDGPITANNPMGVHHGWGRTLKDVAQRYQALRGRELRWQYGFDCQGLWVEVEAEKALGLDAKHEIEDYGLEQFARACRDRVARCAGVITAQSRRLGMWADWERSYYTLTDANISGVWGFLAACHERGWLYRGERLMPWCVRCGTSLSQHELADAYEDLRHPSLFVALPLRERPGEHLVVWTTTPWTLPANTAAAIHPGAAYVRLRTPQGVALVAAERAGDLPFGGTPEGEVIGADLVGLAYEAPFADLPAQQGVTPRVVAWEGVSLAEGTGVVHLAPGCGEDDHQLGSREGLAVLSPLDDAGRFTDAFGWLAGTTAQQATAPIVERLEDAGRLLHAGEVTHRYPVCWRCDTPLVHRLAAEWFLALDPLRERLLDAAATVRWQPAHAGKQMRAWLEQMGDWCISRRRYWGLPLPFWFCSDGHLTVVASKADLLERALAGTAELPELHRPWVDRVVLACATCEAPAERVPEVGDCWLDAGIVAFSTLGWGNRGWVEGGYADGAGADLSAADLPDHAHWQRWFPAHLVCEMREQVRLWFYALLVTSVVLDGRAPYRTVLAHGLVHDEHGREMHASAGNTIWFDEAVERMGADTMRWVYASHDPARDLLFGFGPAAQAERRFLTAWNTYAFLVTYANVAGWTPSYGLLEHGPEPRTSLDRWLLARTDAFVRTARAALDAFDTTRFTSEAERYWSELSNWYVRRSRRRAWDATDGGDPGVLESLWHALVTLARCLAPVMPFVADELWRNLVCAPLEAAPDSVHLAGYPDPNPAHADHALLAEMDDARRVAELGRAARAQADIRLRQPLAALLIASHERARLDALHSHADLIAAECNVRKVGLVDDPAALARTEVAPVFAVLGPRRGAQAQTIARRLREGRYERDGAIVRVDGEALAPDEYTLRLRAGEDLSLAEGHGFVVAADTAMTAELVLEGRARDLIREIQQQRKDLDLALTDRVTVTHPAEQQDVVAAHAGWIAAETLAQSLEPGDTLTVRPTAPAHP